ncbi:MAG: hypothetical protein ABIQ38_03870 [Ilumatobacteraceae bacterium]
MRMSRIARRLRTNLKNWVGAHAEGSTIQFEYEQLRQLQLSTDYLMTLVYMDRKSTNPLDAYARKIFSQADEDGITLEILKRIGISDAACLEVGAGNGLENNTLVLLAHGWKAIWIDGVSLAFDSMINPKRLFHAQRFVTRENLIEIVKLAPENFTNQVELISVDIDGNDGYLIEEFFVHDIMPSVYVVETNEAFPPPIVFKQKYSVDHVYDKSRNFGWSLQAYVDLFSQHGYKLVACNPQTGVNAFFVRGDHVHHFVDVPTDLNQLYVGRSIHPFKYRDHKLQFDAATIAHLIRELD